MKNVQRAIVIGFDRGLTAVITAWLGLVLVLAIAQLVLPVLDHQTIVIRGRSMEPAIPFASLVIIDRTRDEIAAGEVVTFRAENGVLVTHRVVEVLEEGAFLRTAGDANGEPDPMPIAAAQVEGVAAWSAPMLGYPLGILSNPFGFASLLLAMAALSLDLFWAPNEADERNTARTPAPAKLTR